MNEATHKRKTLNAKRTVDFIRQHPEGVTAKDFDKAGIPLVEIERLMQLRFITGKQVKEPKRGPRSYHWVWKAVGPDNPAPPRKKRRRRQRW